VSFWRYLASTPSFIFSILVASFASLAILLELLIYLGLLPAKLLFTVLIAESAAIVFTPKLLTFLTDSRPIADALASGLVLLGMVGDTYLNPLVQFPRFLATYFVLGALAAGIAANHLITVSLTARTKRGETVCVKKW